MERRTFGRAPGIGHPKMFRVVYSCQIETVVTMPFDGEN